MLYGALPPVTLSDNSVVPGIVFRIPNPPKKAVLRLPTTEEMTSLLDKRRAIRRSLGRGKTQSDWITNHKAYLEIFNKIRLDKDGPEFDEFEATTAVGKLTDYDVVGCDETDAEFRISLKTPFGTVTHVVGKPSEQDAFVYRRYQNPSTDLPFGQEEVRYPAAPAIAFYDAIAHSVEGYMDGIAPKDVPPHHKVAVAAVVSHRSNEATDLALDPNS